MEEGDVYFVTRNADPRDHRRPGTVVTAQSPGYIPPAAAAGSTRVYGTPATYAGPAMLAPSGAMYPQGYYANQQPSYLPPPPNWGWGQPGTLGGLFGGLNGLNIGTLIDLVGQGFAAVRSLPTPPTASGDGTTDTANLILYQQALAQHGKTDEQIRTAVHVIGKLLGA